MAGISFGKISNLVDDLLRLFFPATCAVCSQTLVRGEELLCLECAAKMPVTNFHLKPYNNELTTKLIDTSAPIERAVSYFFYKRENPYSRLIQEAKYSNRPQIARILARNYAASILPSGFFNDIDGIVPVPIHWFKQLKRGYNQTHYIADGISEVTGIPVIHLLRASRPHKTQTRKSATSRRSLLDSVFSTDAKILTSITSASSASGVNPASALHLLLVDDVITTGSTILSCARILHRSIPGLRISILSLTTTSLN